MHAKGLFAAFHVLVAFNTVLAENLAVGRLKPRQVPGGDKLREAIKERMLVEDNESLFNSGVDWGAVEDLPNQREELEMYGTLVASMAEDFEKWDWVAQTKYSDYFEQKSRAYAELTTGVAYVVLPPGNGKQWEKGSYWNLYEWPYLQRDDVVVYRLSLEDRKYKEKIWP